MLIKILVIIWPFLKELLLDDKTVPQAMSKHKKGLLIVLVVFTSLALNFFTIPKLFHISQDYLSLKKKMETQKPVTPKPPVVQLPEKPPVAAPVKEVPKKHKRRHKQRMPHPGQVEDRYRRTQEEFERIRLREARSNIQ